MKLNDLAMYHFHRYSQCLCLDSAREFNERGDDDMVLFELFNWAMHMEEADNLYAVIKPHHSRLYCESRAYE